MKKGFTLIEMLAIIVIISVIAIITIPIVMGVVSSAKTNIIQREVEMIKKAAENYIADLTFKNLHIPEYIFLDDLTENGFIEKVSNFKNGAVKININGEIEFIDTLSTNSEVVFIDPNRTVSSIIIEGNSIQNTSVEGVNLLNAKNLLRAANEQVEVIDGVRAYKYTGETNRDIEPIFLKAGTYTIVSRAKRVFGTNGTTQTQYWGFDFATNDQTYPTAVIKGTLVNNVNTDGWFDSVRTITVATDVWINRIHEYSYSTSTAGFYYIDIDSLGLYYGNYNISNIPNEKYTPSMPSFQYESQIKSVEGNININGISYALPYLAKTGTIVDTYNLTTGHVIKNNGLLTLNNTETWNIDGNYYFTLAFGSGNNSTIPNWLVENSFHNLKNESLVLNKFFFVSSGAGYFEFSKYKFPTLSIFQTHLSSNHIKVLYTLKSPLNQSHAIIDRFP